MATQTTTQTTGTTATTDFAPALQNVVQPIASTDALAAISDIMKDGAVVDVSPRSKLNFITATGMTVTVTDNSVNDRVDVTISSPGTVLDYVQITVPVTVNSGSEASSVAIISGNSVTYDGGLVKLEFQCSYTTLPGAAIWLKFMFYRDTTPLGQFEKRIENTANSSGFFMAQLDTPSAAAHTYSVKAFEASATGSTVGAGAGGSGAYMPAFLRVTKA